MFIQVRVKENLLKCILCFFIVFSWSNQGYAQCTGCTTTINNPNNGNVNVNSGQVVCITGTGNIQNYSNNGGTICIASGADIAFPSNTQLNQGTIEVYGDLSATNLTVQGSGVINVYDNATLDVTDLTVSGEINVDPLGTINAEDVEFAENDGTISGDMSVSGEFYLHSGDAIFADGSCITATSFRTTNKAGSPEFQVGSCLNVATTADLSGSTIIDGQITVGGDLMMSSGANLTGSGILYVVDGESTIVTGASINGIMFYDANTANGFINNGTNPSSDPAANGFDNFNDQNNQSNFTVAGTEPVVNCCLVILPVTYGSFGVEKKEDKAIIVWTTLSEINSSHFVIEKSTDGVDFSEIGVVNAQGKSNELKQYTFIDDAPYVGDNYYRLKQVDFNAEAAYSDVQTVSFSDGSDDYAYALFPNPAYDFIKVNTDSPELIVVKIYNIDGQLVQTQKGKRNIEMEISDLIPGLYLLKTYNENSDKLLYINRFNVLE